MKKKVFLLIVFLMVTIIPPVSAEEVEVSAQSAIVMCANNGEVLYAKNERQQRSMASTTKIMTALLTLEAAQADNREVTITQQMVTVEGSSMGLQVGDIVTLDALAKGMLLRSGNDAANAAAIALAGSQEAFADMMNAKAEQIGMKDTHFVTPSGLDDEQHYTTAYDMALLGVYAMEMPAFQEIASQRSMKVEYVKPDQTVIMGNHNRLLSMYQGCIGVKTGFTKKSGRCLVSCAERDGVRLVAVTLNAPDDWNDHERMLDYGFSQVQSKTLNAADTVVEVPVVGGTAESVTVSGFGTYQVVVPSSKEEPEVTAQIELQPFLYAPLEQGQLVGQITYLSNGKEIATAPLTVGEKIDAVMQQKNWFSRLLDWIQGK